MSVNHFSLPESFLHFVWRARYINPHATLCTHDGLPIEIIHPGYWNHDQGPDFLQAQLSINGVFWHGHVEIHIDANDWYHHKHHHDPHYNGVILHVVLRTKHKKILRQDGTAIPELVVEPHIPKHVFHHYDKLLLSQEALSCSHSWDSVPVFVKRAWLTRLAVERMEHASDRFRVWLTRSHHQWNQLIWEAIAANMGGPVNKEAFRIIARTIPIDMLTRYQHKPLQQEALLMGSAGLLQTRNPEGDTYYQRLRNEWDHLRRKHGLPEKAIVPLRFHRMRPASFPTIRLSQLAAIASTWPKLTSLLSPEHISLFMQIPIAASSYWDAHYRFGEAKTTKQKHLGKSVKSSIVINTIIPVSILYQQTHGEDPLPSWLEALMEQISPEQNRRTRHFSNLSLSPRNALESQGMIQLHKHYCVEKKCLDCAIGAYIIGKKRPENSQKGEQTLPINS